MAASLPSSRARLALACAGALLGISAFALLRRRMRRAALLERALQGCSGDTDSCSTRSSAPPSAGQVMPARMQRALHKQAESAAEQPAALTPAAPTKKTGAPHLVPAPTEIESVHRAIHTRHAEGSTQRRQMMRSHGPRTPVERRSSLPPSFSQLVSQSQRPSLFRPPFDAGVSAQGLAAALSLDYGAVLATRVEAGALGALALASAQTRHRARLPP